jgi:MFS family permease
MMSVFFLVSFAMSSMEAVLIMYVGEKFGWDVKQVSFGFAYIGVIIVFTQGFLVRKLIPRIGEKKMMLIGLSLFATGMTLIAGSHSIQVLAIAMTLLSLGNGLTNPSILGSISLLADAAEQGIVMGVTQSMSSLGRILGPLLGGFIYSFLHIGPFLNSGLLGFYGLVIVIYNFNKLPNSGKQHASAQGAH